MQQDPAKEDVLLVNALVGGDRLAFDRIYHKYAASLFEYARRSVASREECEEFVQEIFISLWERRESLEIEVLRFYLFKMMRYYIIRYFQHSKVKRKYQDHFLLFETLYESAGNEDRVDLPALQAWIDQSIARLPDRCRTVFTLRLKENLSTEQIAHRMQLSKRTVENYSSQAISLLKTSYRKWSASSILIVTSWWSTF